MDAPRIGIIGARRRAQGIGQYVARDLAALGANICAIAGTSRPSVEQARDDLCSNYGLSVRDYVGADEMIRGEKLDAVAICSPQQFHRQHLHAALAQKLHVLCEKPFVFDPQRDNLADARAIVEGFADAARILMINQQWPYTLAAYDRCYPGGRQSAPLARFEMLLAPAEDGFEMIPNALPHVLSMLSALAPEGGHVEQIEFERPGLGRMNIRFLYRHETGTVEVSAHLLQAPQQPRPAGYAINDCAVIRRIDLPSYQMFFEKSARGLSESDSPHQDVSPQNTAAGPRDHWFAVEDPLRLLLADFIRRLEEPQTYSSPDPHLLEGVRMLDEIYHAASEASNLN
jgi:hypothetical protein